MKSWVRRDWWVWLVLPRLLWLMSLAGARLHCGPGIAFLRFLSGAMNFIALVADIQFLQAMPFDLVGMRAVKTEELLKKCDNHNWSFSCFLISSSWQEMKKVIVIIV